MAGTGTLFGGDSTLFNNSTITDSGSSATGANVIDLSSTTGGLNIIGSTTFAGSVNHVTLTGSGTSIITNINGNDTITTVPTHNLILNGVDGVWTSSVTNGVTGGLNVSIAAALIAAGSGDSITTASGIYVGSSLATAAHISGATTGAGLVIIESGTTTQMYVTDNVTAIPTVANDHLFATLVGVAAPSAVHLVA